MSKKKAGAPAGDVTDLDKLDATSKQIYDNLFARLQDAGTLKELQAAVDSDFKQDVARLPEFAQRMLRDSFAVFRDLVKHRVKMDALVGKTVIVSDPPEFPTPTKINARGELSVWCVIKGVIEDGDTFECRSSAIRIVRHFQDSKLDSYPQRLEFYQESHASMVARNAVKDSSPMWLVRHIAPARERGDGIPF